ADLPATKSDVRNHLRAMGREEVWTEMQGRVYGPRLGEAAAYPGVLEFVRAVRTAGIPVAIISHKTRHPFLGEKHDLHAAAWGWLEQEGFFDSARIGLPRDHVFFELTKQAKLERIGAWGCTHFIDDLPEFLGEASFPAGVERWLFDPNDLYREETRFHRLGRWEDAGEALGLRTADATSVTMTGGVSGGGSGDEAHDARVRAFLARCGLPEPVAWTPLPGGANNRVFLVRSAGTTRVLKRYFHHPADTRDRFGAERAFYTWAWDHGLRSVPEPLGWDAEARLGLFAQVEGRKLEARDVDATRVNEAAELVMALNASRFEPGAAGIPAASEACFSVAAHLACVERRVTRLREMSPESELDQEAASLVREELVPAWQEVGAELRRGPTAEELPLAARVISPSDFGYHNALLAADGRLRFLDFEYAGWDDPAKLVCDFFCQPQVPVDWRHWPALVGALERGIPGLEGLEARARRLFPAYQIKWCCIILNEFLRGDRARRAFAHGAEAVESRKRAQLDKACFRLRAARETWGRIG
ncbi:MAG: phosphotransferase, partial [Verrucomicrobiales bacterium]|nr:phosphotransferase [Verrucomicrobiales bacterium]